MKDILLLIHDDAGQEARLRAALELNSAVHGHLTCVDVTPPIIIASGFSIGFGDTVVIDERERETLNKAKITVRLEREGIAWDWLDAYGDAGVCLREASCLTDLIVLNCELDKGQTPEMGDLASRLLMDVRVPILAVPEKLHRLNFSGGALIAWDGSTSVTATMRACLPLLALASQVEIFAVFEKEKAISPNKAADYLTRHGIDAEVIVANPAGASPVQLILTEADRRDVDYIVMGAYGHGRLREMFGGVTKRMLTESKYPLILGH
jgi:nucleotide-binding universal stress UspA family protein